MIYLPLSFVVLFLAVLGWWILARRDRYPGKTWEALLVRAGIPARLGAAGLDLRRFGHLKLAAGLGALLLGAASAVRAMPGGVVAAGVLFFVPETAAFLVAVSTRRARRREILFLKRLFILNGSIEPVAFDEVIGILRAHACLLAPLLVRIENGRKSNSARMRELYEDLSIQSRDLEVSLFLEKLSQADRIDFREGLRSIRTDFAIEKLGRRRQCEKTREAIEITGLILTMLLTGLLAYYLVLPWLQAYSLQALR